MELIDPRQLINRGSYVSMLEGAYQAGRHDLVKYYFQLAKTHGFNDIVLYNILIKSAAKAKELKEALQFFKEAKDTKIVDSYTYSAAMDAGVESGSFETVEAFFQEAIKKGFTTPILYNTMMMAERSGRWILAQELLQSAVDQGHTDPATYSLMIKLAAQHQDFSLVCQLLALAFQTKNDNELNEDDIEECLENFCCYRITQSSKNEFFIWLKTRNKRSPCIVLL